MSVSYHRGRFFRAAVPALCLALAWTPLGVGLVGCAALQGASASQQIGQAAGDVATIADGLAAILPRLGHVADIDPATVAKIGGYVADLQTLSASLAKAGTTAQARPLVKQVESFVNAIAGSLAGLALPPPIGPAIAAAGVLLPVVETAVNLAVPATPRAGGMTPAEARRYLKKLAARHPTRPTSPDGVRARRRDVAK